MNHCAENRGRLIVKATKPHVRARANDIRVDPGFSGSRAEDFRPIRTETQLRGSMRH